MANWRRSVLKQKRYFKNFDKISEWLAQKNILDGSEGEINGKHRKHVQQRVQFSPIISEWEFQKFKLAYLEKVLMKFRENFEYFFLDSATYHYLKLIDPTEFRITLSVYGSAGQFLNFCHYKSKITSAEKFRVHCLRNGSFKT